MGLLKFGVCVVTWILCASKSSGNNTTLLNSESECIEGQDLPSVGPCNKCICTQGKIFCINMECGLETKQNETRSGPESNSLYEKIGTSEKVFNETRRHRIDVINKKSNNKGLPHLSSVITVDKTDEESPNISMILTKTHVDNTFKTFLSNSYDSDKYILIIPEVSNGEKKHLQKRDVSSRPNIWKKKLHSELGQQPSRKINLGAYGNSNRRDNNLVNETRRGDSPQAFRFGNNNSKRPRQALRNNQYYNQHKMVSSQFQKKEVSKQHNMVSSQLQKRSDHYQMSQSQVSKQHKMVSSHLKKSSDHYQMSHSQSQVSKQHKMVSSHSKKKSDHYQMSQSQAQKKSSKFKFSYKAQSQSQLQSQSQYSGNSFQTTRVTRAPNIKIHTPDESFPFPQSKYVQPNQHVIKKPEKKLKQPMSDYDPDNIKHLMPATKNVPVFPHPGMQYSQPFSKPDHNNPIENTNKKPFNSYPQTPKNKHKLRPNKPKPKPIKALIPQKPIKIIKPYNPKKKLNRIPQILIDITAIYPDIENTNTPQYKTPFGKIPNKNYGDPEAYTDNNNEPLNKLKKYPQQSYPKNHYPDDETAPQPYQNRNKRLTTKVPKIPFGDPKIPINSDITLSSPPKKYLPKHMGLDNYNSQQMIDDELDIYHENYEDYRISEDLIHKKSTPNMPLTENTKLNPYQPKFKDADNPHFEPKINPDYDSESKPIDDKLTHKKSESKKSKMKNMFSLILDLISKKKNPKRPDDKSEMYPDYNDSLEPNDKSPNSVRPTKPKNLLPKKNPNKPKQPDDSSSSNFNAKEEMDLDYENYDNTLAHKGTTTKNPFYPNKFNEPNAKKPLKYPDHEPDKPEMYPDNENYPVADNLPLAPFFLNKDKKPTGKIPQLLKPLLDNQSEEPETYPDDENYPDSNLLPPFYPNKGKKPKDKIQQLLKPLLDKFPYKPKRPHDSHPDYHKPDEPGTYPDDENYPIPNSHPLAPFSPKKGKKPTDKIPQLLKPLLDKFPYKPKRPDDTNPDSDQSDEPKMYPHDKNYPDSNPLAPFFPKKGKKPTDKITQLLKPLLDKIPYKPKRPDDSNPDSVQSDEPKMYPDDTNYPDSNPLAPFSPKKGKRPTDKIPQLLKPLLDKFPYKPKQPDDSHPDSQYPSEPDMYPDDEDYPTPENDPSAPFFPNKGKKPKTPQLLKPLPKKSPYKPKRPHDSNPDSHQPDESEIYPDDDNHPIPNKHPLAPFFPNKNKKPKDKIPQFLKPLLDKFPYKPQRPYDSNPDSDQSDEPKMYPDDKNYPDSNPLAPFLPNKGKNPKDKIPAIMKPLLDKFPYKPKRPDDSNPDSDQSDEPKMYPDDKNYPHGHPLAPFLPNKGKKPKDKTPQLLKPLLDKFPYKPKRPDDSYPDSQYPSEPEIYPDDKNYPTSENDPSAPFFPNKGKKPKAPQLLKPLPKKSPYKPKRPHDSNPDSHQPDESDIYPDDDNHPIPNKHPMAPFFPNKNKKPKDKIPQLLKPLLDKFPYKPQRPYDSNPDSDQSGESKMYPDDKNYPDSNPLAPFLPSKGKMPTSKVPGLLKPLLDKFPYKPKRPHDSRPDSHNADEPEMYPDDKKYPIPDNHPLTPFSPQKGKRPKDNIPDILKPLLDKFPYKPKRPDDSHPDSQYPSEPDMYPDDEDYPTPENYPSSPFIPNKGKKPKIPQLLNPLSKKSPYKPKRPDDSNPDSDQSNEPKMYPDDKYNPGSHPLAPFLPNKGKKPTNKIPESLKPLLDKFPYKPKRPDDSYPDSHKPDEPEMYPDDENYPIPENHPLAPYFPNKGKKPTDKIPQLLKPLLDKLPFKPKRPDDSNPDSDQSDAPKMYPDYGNNPIPDDHPLAPFLPNKGKKPTSKIPEFLKPLLDKFPFKPKRPDDSHPDSHYPNESEMYPDDENYPIPENHPLAPLFPKKGKKPTDKIPQLLKPLLAKLPYKPKRPDDSNPDSDQSDEPKIYPNDGNNPIPDDHPLAPFLSNKGKKPTSKIPEFLKPLLDKFPFKPKRPDDSHPYSPYYKPDEPEMYPDDENYPLPNNYPLAPFFPKKGKKPIHKIPQLLKPSPKKSPYKPKRPDDSHPDSDYPDESEMYPDDENYPIPENHPLAPFFPKKGKKPTEKIPKLLKPLLAKLPYKPKRPDDSNPDSDQSDEPKMYSDDENNPIPDNHPLAPFLPIKGKKPTDKIPQLLKPLLNKFPYKPKRPEDSHPDSHYPNESEMYPDDENYAIPDNHPLAPFLPNKNKKPKTPHKLKPLPKKSPFKPKQPDDSNPDSHYPDEPGMYPDDKSYPSPDNNPQSPVFPNKGKKPATYIPQSFKPLPKKSTYKPKRPHDSYPDSHQPDEPEMYPDDEDYPIPDNHPLAPFFPNKGKKPTSKIPKLLKPLIDKLPFKPKRPDDSNPDSDQSNEPKMYPDNENYPDSQPLAPFLPNKGKKPSGKIPELLKPLFGKLPYKPKRPDDSHPDSHYPTESDMYPDYENYPIPDNHPLAPFFPNKGKKPTDKIPELLKPLLAKLLHKPKGPNDSYPDSPYPKEPDMYPDSENHPIPDNHPLAPFFPNKGKKPTGKIPELLKPLLAKLLHKPKGPDDSHPDSHYPNEPDLYPDEEHYPIPDNHPLAPFLPNKGKKPTGEIPELLKPLLAKLLHKPKGPNDSHPDSHHPNEPDMYPDDEIYPIPDNHPLAPFFPNKGKKPTGKIPELLKPLLAKLLHKPKGPNDSHPDSHYPNEPEMYPDDENYPIPDNHPLAPFFPNKGKKPTGEIPELLKPLLAKLLHKPKRPDDLNPDSDHSDEPKLYPDDGNNPIPDHHPLAPFFPNNGKKPSSKIPEFLKPLLDKFPYKPKRPDDSHPDSNQSDVPNMYPDDEIYPGSHPLAPFFPKKAKKPTKKIPQLLKPLPKKSPYKPKRPDDLHPNSHRSDEPEMYPGDENYPMSDKHPLAPFITNKNKKPTSVIPQYLKPLFDKYPYKPKQPGDSNPDFNDFDEPEMYPDGKNYLVPKKQPLSPLFPNNGKDPIGNIPQLLKPLSEFSPFKPNRPDDFNPDSYHPDEPEMYPDDKKYPLPHNHPLSPLNPNKDIKPTGIIPQYLKPLLDKFYNKPKRPDDYNPDYHHSDEPEMYPDIDNKPKKNISPFHPTGESPFYPYKGKKPELYPDYGNEPSPSNNPLTPKNPLYGSPFYPKHGKQPISDLPEMFKPKKYPHSPKGPIKINPDEPDTESDYELNVVNDDYLQIYNTMSEVKSKISKESKPNSVPDKSLKEPPCKLNSPSDNEPTDHSYKLPFKLDRPLAGNKLNNPKNFSDDSHEPSSDYINPLINATSQYKPIILADNSQEPQFFPLLGDENTKNIPINFSDNSHEPLKLSFKPFDEKKPEYSPNGFSNDPKQLYQLTTPFEVNKPQYISNTLSDNSLEQPFKYSTPFSVLQPVYRPHSFLDNSLEQPFKMSTTSDVKEPDYRPISIYNNIPEQSFQLSTPLDADNLQYGPNSFSKNSHEQPFQDYTLINSKKPQYKPGSFSINEPIYQSFRPLDDEKPRYAAYKLTTPYDFSHELPLPTFNPQYRPNILPDNTNVLYTKSPKFLGNGHEYIPGKGFGWHNSDNLPNNDFEMSYSSAPFTKTLLDIVPQDNIRSKESSEQPLNTSYSNKYKLGPFADSLKFPQRPDRFSEYNRGVNYMKWPKDDSVKLNAMKYKWLASDEQIKQFPVTPNSMMNYKT